MLVAHFDITFFGLPFCDETDHRVRRLDIHLSGVCAIHATNITRKLDHCHVHTETDAQIGDFVLSRISDGCDLPLDPSVSETTRY